MEFIWGDLIKHPLTGRAQKPRNLGLTMVIDKGLPIRESQSLLELMASFFDFIKLSFGTIALYPREILIQKIKLAKSHEINLYPGGTFFEIALWQSKANIYFEKLKDLGFQWVEISDGTLEISKLTRTKLIKDAITIGLNVITEVGKKDFAGQPDDEKLIAIAEQDLEAGAQWVIIEGRESGIGIGIFDNQGNIILDKLEKLSTVLPLEKIIWEAPLKKQQALLINKFGSNVNLGNIPFSEIMALEALRLGYRNDTWKQKI